MLLKDGGGKQQQAAGVSPFPFKEEGVSSVRMAAKVKGKGDTEVGFVCVYMCFGESDGQSVCFVLDPWLSYPTHSPTHPPTHPPTHLPTLSKRTRRWARTRRGSCWA